MITVDICSYDGPDNASGPYVWLQRMPCQLRSLGFNVRIRLFSFEPNPAEGAGYRFLVKLGFEVGFCRIAGTRDNIGWLLEQCLDHPPDVFVANHVVPALLACRQFRKWGIPTVGIIRSDDVFYRAVIDVFVRGNKPDRLGAVVCVSSYLEQFCLSAKIDGLLVSWIPSGTPIPAETVKPRTGKFHIAYVGRFVEEQKRISDLVHAMCRLCAAFSDIEVSLVGSGPARPDMERIIRNAGQDQAVSIAGHLEPQAVDDLLSTVHVIVLLSDYEGTPTAVMEGMAHGCVPVCLDLRSGIRDLIQDRVNGIIIKDRDEDLIRAIRELKNDPVRWQALSTAARTKAINDFSTQQSALKWSDLLKRLSQNRRPPRSIAVPGWISLPPVHPDLAHQDRRGDSFGQKVVKKLSRLRFWGGKLKRKTRLILGLENKSGF